MIGLRLYLVQRLSAAVMAPLVLIHLGLMIYAIRGGLSASEILGRTQGSMIWGAYYALFVLAVSAHGAVGLRVIGAEWLGLRGQGLTALTWAIFVLLLGLGGRAVWAVVGG